MRSSTLDTHLTCVDYGSANATRASDRPQSWPSPPAAITTYCRPFASLYVIGVALPPAGSLALHSSSPVRVSKARSLNSIAAAMKVTPPAVAIGPPRFGTPWMCESGIFALAHTRSRDVPSGVRQRIFPVRKLTPTNSPHGGLVQGIPIFDTRI